MLTALRDLNDDMASLKSNYAKLKGLKHFRHEFMKSPVMSLEVAHLYKGLNQDILKFKKVFEVKDNVELGKADALDIVNLSILNMTEAATASELRIVDDINKIMDANDKLKALITDDPQLAVTKASLLSANSSMAYSELFEKKIAAKLAEIMAEARVAAPDYISWLYGIYNDFNQDHIEEILAESDYSGLEHTVATSEAYSNTIETNLGSMPTLSDYADYDTIRSLSETPDTRISGLTITTNLVKLFINARNKIKETPSHIHFNQFDKFSNMTTELKNIFKDDPMGAIDDTVDDVKYLHYMVLLAIAAKRVRDTEIDIYKGLVPYLQAQSLLFDFTTVIKWA